ncbi:MAG: MFS transporter [Promethearchaeota archaeon]
MSEDQLENTNNTTFKELRTLSVGEAVAYSLPNAGTNAVLGIIVSFTILYYVNIMGIPPLIAGGIFSLAMYLYAFLCPIFGALCDKFETKIGRKKTMMLLTGPPYMIFFLLLWMNPIPPKNIEFGAIYLPIILWYTIFLFAFRFCGSAFAASYSALLPELSTDEKNRIMISTINMLVMIVGVAISMLGPIILLGDTTEGLSRDNPELYYPNSEIGRSISTGVIIFAIIMVILFIVSFIIMMIVIKEPDIKSCSLTIHQVISDLGEPFKDNNYRYFLLAYFLLWIPLVSLNYLLMNLITFVIQLRGQEFIWFAGVAFISAVSAFLFWNKLSDNLGLKKTTSICIIISIIAFLLIYTLTLPMEHDLKVFYGFFVVGICLLGYVGSMIFPWAIVGDIVDSAELKTGRSLSGPYVGGFNFVLSFAAATSMLMISIFLELWGPQSPTAYALVFVFGAFLLGISVIIFQKVLIVGTDQRKRE